MDELDNLIDAREYIENAVTCLQRAKYQDLAEIEKFLKTLEGIIEEIENDDSEDYDTHMKKECDQRNFI